MIESPRGPWQPDLHWANPLLGLLLLLALAASTLALLARRAQLQQPPSGVGLQGRLLEVSLAGPGALAPGLGPEPRWEELRTRHGDPWERALLQVLQAEREVTAHRPAPPSDPALDPGFRQVYEAAYHQGPRPEPALRQTVHRRLGGGYAADCLAARLGDGVDLAAALQALGWRFLGLAVLGLLVTTLGLAGVGVGGYLTFRPGGRSLPALPSWAVGPRAAALVFLAWFLAFFLAGPLASRLLAPWPGLRWAGVPLAYALHAMAGVWLIAWAEGVRIRTVARRVLGSGSFRDLAWTLGFLALAVFLVVVVALGTQALFHPQQNPQRDLQEMLRGLAGWGPSLVLFATVAGLAPCFEELMFRGFLLPVLAPRLGVARAIVLTGLLFGAIHLQPAGFPVLSTLGLVLGLALRETGGLRTPILVHACWNGGLFLLVRAFA